MVGRFASLVLGFLAKATGCVLTAVGILAGGGALFGSEYTSLYLLRANYMDTYNSC